jgi:hypothetical protein
MCAAQKRTVAVTLDRPGRVKIGDNRAKLTGALVDKGTFQNLMEHHIIPNGDEKAT